ncbi:MAG: VOC family protein [Bacteroidota bacterium]|jgi:hypothetical protein
MKLTIFRVPRIYFRCFYCIGLLFFYLLCFLSLPAQTVTTQRDLTEPLSSPTDALCGPIQIITICSNQPDSLITFFEKGWGMRRQGPLKLSRSQQKKLAVRWHLPQNASFQLIYFDRPAAPGTIAIRVIVFDQPMPLIRSSYGARELGPFTIGFPNAKQEEVHAKLQQMGYATLAPMQAAMLSKADGSKYKYLETIYKGPEWLHAVGIERGNGMPQLSNIDSSTGLGGPGYSAMNVTGMSDTIISFLTGILGYELRRDQVWTTSSGSALGMEAGIPFRFVIAYAKGATSGHFLLLDFKNMPSIASARPPHLPNAGIGMYSVETHQLDEVLARAVNAGIKIISPPGISADPVRGKYKSILLMAPNQVFIEVIEK